VTLTLTVFNAGSGYCVLVDLPSGVNETGWQGQSSKAWPPFHHSSHGRCEQIEDTPVTVSPRRNRNAPTLPALAWALGIQKRAARVGFDYGDPASAARDVGEEAAELAAASTDDEFFREFGDLLFALVNVARKRKVNPEDALRSAGRRFVDRFKAMEALASQRGVDLGRLEPAALQALWSESP